MRMPTELLARVGAVRLQGWGSWDPAGRQLETVGDMT